MSDDLQLAGLREFYRLSREIDRMGMDIAWLLENYAERPARPKLRLIKGGKA